jgi:hypothetical protein
MKYPKKSFKRNLSGYTPYEFREGELIEEKVARLTQEKSPINDGAPIIYTERKDGVLPAYDIRTDRWEIAQAAMEVNQKAISAKRQRDYDGLVEGENKNLNSGNKEINQNQENSGAA